MLDAEELDLKGVSFFDQIVDRVVVHNGFFLQRFQDLLVVKETVFTEHSGEHLFVNFEGGLQV